MSGTQSGIVGAVIASVCAVAVVVGCSASGSSGDIDESVSPTDPTATATGGGAQLPPPSDNPDDPSATPTGDSGSGATDAGKVDSGVDAGPPPPVPGTACTTPNAITKKSCGACGTQSTVCLAGGDGGAGTWTDYSACEGELAGGCIAGSTEQIACGNCGTQSRTCTKYCAWTTAACTGQPAGACTPGNVDLTAAGCTTAETFHQRTCDATCTYDNFSTTCAAPPATVQVPPSLAQVNTTITVLKSTQTVARLDGECSSATVAATVTPYVYLKVHNPNAKSAVVSVWVSKATGGHVFDTIMAAYAGATSPSTAAQRKACTSGVNEYGDDSLTGDSSFASLSDTDAITIPADGTATIYVAAYSKYAAGNPDNSTGELQFNVRADQLE